MGKKSTSTINLLQVPCNHKEGDAPLQIQGINFLSQSQNFIRESDLIHPPLITVIGDDQMRSILARTESGTKTVYYLHGRNKNLLSPDDSMKNHDASEIHDKFTECTTRIYDYLEFLLFDSCNTLEAENCNSYSENRE